MNVQALAAPENSYLEFTDSAACERWVQQLPLTNIKQSHQLLKSQITALRAASLPAPERLRILESLRQPIAFVQAECANRYIGRSLPFGVAEQAAWQDVMGLWKGVAGNYEDCLAAYRSGDFVLAGHAALITSRVMRTIGCQMIECYRAYRHVPGELWSELHALYLAAEQYGFLHAPVPDPLRAGASETSCADAYLNVLLAHLSNPYGLSGRQLGFVLRWLEKWTGLVKVARQPSPVSPAPALAVDLDRMGGPVIGHDVDTASNIRYLDVEPLAKAMRQTITALKQGRAPVALGLGANTHQPGCESLLMLLYVQWCRAGASRLEEREEADEDANLCFGIPAAYCQLRGADEIRQPGELTSREKRDLDTFGYVVRARHEIANLGALPVEKWKIGNCSPSGFMCVLREPQGPGRVAHNQIILVQRGTPPEFRAGIVQWMRIEANGDLRCGVRLFPGKPSAVTVRPAEAKQAPNGYERALLLTPDPITATPATLILPPGWFQCGAFIEVVTDRHQVATMLTLLERGGDFDRGTVVLI
jgi:hypothetical protein